MPAAVIPLARASLANSLFHASNPAAVLPHCAALASLPVHATASNTAKIAAFEPQYFEPQYFEPQIFVTEEHSFGAPQRLRARVSSFTNCVSGLSGSAFPLHRQDQMEALESQMT